MNDQSRCLSTSLCGGRARGQALWARSVQRPAPVLLAGDTALTNNELSTSGSSHTAGYRLAEVRDEWKDQSVAQVRDGSHFGLPSLLTELEKLLFSQKTWKISNKEDENIVFPPHHHSPTSGEAMAQLD